MKKNWIRILLLILPYFFIVSTFQLIAYNIIGLPIDSKVGEIPLIQKFVIILSTCIGSYLTILIFRRYIDKETVFSLGFAFDRKSKKTLLIGFVLGLLIISFGFISLIACNELYFIGFEIDIFKLLLSGVIFILISFYEELLFRGYILNNLLASINKYIALMISSVLFVIIHLINPHLNLISFINILLAGILLGLPYIYTKNLWFSFTFHFSWNFFQGTIFGYNVSGLKGYSLITQQPNGNTIWNGGDFGFEGSIICTIVIIGSIYLLYLFYQRQLKQERGSLNLNIV